MIKEPPDKQTVKAPLSEVKIGDVFGQGHGKILFFKDLDGNVVVGLRHRRFQRGDRSFESEGAREEEVCGGWMKEGAVWEEGE